MPASVTYKGGGARRKLASLARLLSPDALDKVVKKAALVTYARIKKETPKRFSGQTRKSWEYTSIRRGTWKIFTASKVMTWLEKGTKAHGPVTAKHLYIPLTRRAFNARMRGEYSKLKYGKDFIFSKRVRGIKAIGLVSRSREQAARTLRAAIILHIRRIIR